MNDRAAWAKALLIPDGLFNEWKANAPTGESFTYWCLHTGRLNEEKYFSWAMNHYGLTQVQSGYFDLVPNTNLWGKIRSVANWSPWMIPLDEWDGSIFIGCVEPPETPWSFPVVYVLAQPAQLESLWNQYHENTELVQATSVHVAADGTGEAERSNVTQTIMRMEESDMPSEDTSPMGLKLDLSKLTREPSPFERLQQSVEEESDGSEFADDSPPMNLNLDMEDLPLQEDAPVNLKLEIAPKVNSSAAASTKPGSTPRPPPLAKPVEKKKITPPPPAEAVDFATSPGRSIGMSNAPEDIESATTEDECVAWYFRQMKSRYTHQMILGYDGKGLTAWRWESSNERGNPGGNITFDSPSLFRIVARTLRPYHGFVVDNPTHQAFFISWGHTALPTHVTATPVVIGNKFRALFLCVGTDKTANLECLKFAERTADKTLLQLEKVKSSLVSASEAA